MSSPEEVDAAGRAYLQHLTDADLKVLVAAGGDRQIAALRSQPALVLDVLDRDRTASELLDIAGEGREQLAFVSPFLLFAAAVHRTAADLAASPYRPERTGLRMRIPVFDAADLVAYLARPWRRFFLIELLASYARISSGVAWTRTARGWQRRRWNDLDPVRLAVLLDSAPQAQQAGILRRLGDSALFLSGVFPDNAARAGMNELATRRLLRLTRIGRAEPPEDDGVAVLEWFGARWYRMAAQQAVAPTDLTRLLQDNAEHFGMARRVLNAAADRYLFPVASDWLRPPAA